MDINKKYFQNEDVIIREIEGEYLMVPIASGIGDMEDEMYTLNETGIAIWEKLSPKKTLETVIEELCNEYDADKKEITNDVFGLIEELFKRKIVLC
ncbi:MAG: PqqD family protein, partial [Desulfobacteraceae bacterium]|nr:PqqD family protein [Desulfobacteraceae bacterium]